MALSRSNHGTSNNGGDYGVSGSFTPQNNSLLVVVVTSLGHGTVNLANSSASGGGLTWTKRLSVGPSYMGGGGGGTYWITTEIWTAPVTTGSSMSVTAGIGPTGGSFSHSIQCFSYTGYDTGSPIGVQVTRDNAADTGAVTINLPSAPASSSEVLAGRARCDNNSYDSSATPGSGWTELYDQVNTGGYEGLQTQARTGSTSTSVSWADIDDDPGPSSFAVETFAIEIKAAGGGGGGPTAQENTGLHHVECGSPMGKKTNGILHPIRHGIVGQQRSVKWRKTTSRSTCRRTVLPKQALYGKRLENCAKRMRA